MNDDPYIYRLPDGLMYAELPEEFEPMLVNLMADLLLADRVLNAEIVYEDILDAEVIE